LATERRGTTSWKGSRKDGRRSSEVCGIISNATAAAIVTSEGQPYEVTTPGGQRFTGTVELYLPRETLAGTVRELDDGWFRLLTWKDGKGSTGVWAWVATYTGDDPRVREFRDQGQQALDRLFPA
jgi:hypothetical protein